MRISLIGMAGTGKSYWADQLTQLGFRRICSDDMIAQRLASDLLRPDGTVMEMGEWLGFPYEPRYRLRERKYLKCEIEVMNRILDNLGNEIAGSDENVVVDTGGSVIYTGERILKKLRKETMVACLHTPPEIKDQMVKTYLENPGPVLWQNLFRRNPDETNETALKRCYQKLLSARAQVYEALADVTIDYYARRKEDYHVNDFLECILSRAKS